MRRVRWRGRQSEDSGRTGGFTSLRLDSHRRLSFAEDRNRHDNHRTRGEFDEQPALAGARAHRRRSVHRHHGHVDHRRRLAEDAGRSRLRPAGPQLGLQRLRRRLRRAAAARRAAVRPLRRPPDLRHGLGDPRCRLPRRRPGRRRRGRADRPRDPGRRLGAHRPGRAHPAVPGVRRQQGAPQGPRPVRRGRTCRRHRRRLPRRRPDRVRVVAVGVLHQHPDRRRRPAADPFGHACRDEQPRLARPRRCHHRHARPRRGRLRDRPRPGGRLDVRQHAPRRPRRPRAPGRVRRAAGQPPSAADAPGHFPRAEPRCGQRRAAAARRRLDPDVLLREPVPAAGPRPRGLRDPAPRCCL